MGDRAGGVFMSTSDDTEARGKRLDEALGAQRDTRRPGTWVSESELRRRARRRNAISLAVAAACMLLFVVLIYLLLERTRGTAVVPDQVGMHVSP